MSSTLDLIKSGANAMSSGKTVDSNSIGSLNGQGDAASESTGVTIDEGLVTTAGESTQDGLLPDDGNQTDSQDTAAKPAAKAKPGTPDKETVVITDETGRRRKVEIDYSDKTAIRKAHELAGGARKWQAERDQEKTSHQATKQRLGELETNWSALEQTFKEKGVEGIIDLLEGRPGAYKQHEKKVIDKARFLDNASPEEIASLEARERADSSAKELAKMRKENEDFRKQMQQERDSAEVKSLEGRVHPVFDKYRFADKLGDANDEQMFDEMLWTTALNRLTPYEEQGLPITPELVDKEFRTVAMSIRKRIGVNAEKKAAKVIDQKKTEATENAQSAVKNGYKSTGKASDARDLINKGDLKSLLGNWGKYGSLFNK